MAVYFRMNSWTVDHSSLMSLPEMQAAHFQKQTLVELESCSLPLHLSAAGKKEPPTFIVPLSSDRPTDRLFPLRSLFCLLLFSSFERLRSSFYSCLFFSSTLIFLFYFLSSSPLPFSSSPFLSYPPIITSQAVS